MQAHGRQSWRRSIVSSIHKHDYAEGRRNFLRARIQEVFATYFCRLRRLWFSRRRAAAPASEVETRGDVAAARWVRRTTGVARRGGASCLARPNRLALGLSAAIPRLRWNES